MAKTLMVGLCVGALIGAVATGAVAEDQTLEFRLVTHGINLNVIPATETEGHVLGVGKMRGVAVFDDGRLADKVYSVSFDYTEGEGTCHGYSTYTFEDGSTIASSFECTSAADAGGGRVIKGTYSDLTGTGQYEGVSGTGSFESRTVSWEPGATLFDGEFKLASD